MASSGKQLKHQLCTEATSGSENTITKKMENPSKSTQGADADHVSTVEPDTKATNIPPSHRRGTESEAPPQLRLPERVPLGVLRVQVLPGRAVHRVQRHPHMASVVDQLGELISRQRPCAGVRDDSGSDLPSDARTFFFLISLHQEECQRSAQRCAANPVLG